MLALALVALCVFLIRARDSSYARAIPHHLLGARAGLVRDRVGDKDGFYIAENLAEN